MAARLSLPLKRAPLTETAGNAPHTVDGKRGKSVELPFEYPKDNVKVPKRSLVEALYQQTAETEDQKELAEAGLLSFQHVLLPAVAYQEEAALKDLQAKVQRDCPEHKRLLEQTRQATYEAVHAAMKAVEKSREARKSEKDACWKKLAEEREEAHKLALEKWQRESELKRSQEMSELQKSYPKNVEAWREVAYLMTELNKLGKEERQWAQAKEQLENEATVKGQQEPLVVDVAGEESPVDQVNQSLEDITLSAIRVQQALRQVSGVVAESQRMRKELYQRYKRDHQFHGYQSHDPKGLLRALSQDP